MKRRLVWLGAAQRATSLPSSVYVAREGWEHG